MRKSGPREREIGALPVGRQRGRGWRAPLDLGPPARGEVERGVTLHPSSPLCTAFPPHRDVVSQMAGAMVDERQLKAPPG
jgi:hypothetical protein